MFVCLHAFTDDSHNGNHASWIPGKSLLVRRAFCKIILALKSADIAGSCPATYALYYTALLFSCIVAGQ